jgi:plastocyanin
MARDGNASLEHSEIEVFEHRFVAESSRRLPTSLLKRRAILTAAVAAFACVAGVGPGIGPADAAEAIVDISDFSFAPAQLTVPAGTTVTWINHDDEPHTIAESNMLFKSHALDTGDKFSFTFTTPGRFQYFCTIHAHMVGSVVVQ